MRRWLAGTLLPLSLFASPSVATAQPAAQAYSARDGDLLVETLVARLFAQRAAGDARWSVELRKLIEHRDAIIRKRTEEARRFARTEAALEASRTRTKVAEARLAGLEAAFLEKDQAYREAVTQIAATIDEMGRRDRNWAAEVAAYRAQFTGFVAEASPEKRALLWRYASGDRASAYALLEDLTALERRVDEDAANRIALELKNAAAAKADNAQRLLGILALDRVGRHEMRIEQATAPWARIVADGRGERADYLALANLWTLAGDDVAAADLRKAGLAKEAQPAVRKDFPILSFVDAVATRQGSQWRNLADLARNPAPATTLQGIDPAIFASPVPAALGAETAPLLDDLAVCEESLTASRDWDLASQQQALSRDSGFPLPAAIGEVAAREQPSLQCARAVAGLSRLLSQTNRTPLTGVLLGNAALLAYTLLEAGERDLAGAMGKSAAIYCAARVRDRSPRDAFSDWGCALLGVAEGSALSASAPRLAKDRIDRALAELRALDIRTFPAPDAAWVVPVTYQLAASVLEESGDLPAAIHAMEKAEAAGRLILKTWRLYPPTKLRTIELLADLAELHSKGVNLARAAASFDAATAQLAAFLRAHPRSFLGCTAFDNLSETRLIWLAKTDRARALDAVQAAAPDMARCEALTGALGFAVPGVFADLTSGKLLRLRIYMDLGEKSKDAIATKALELMVEETQGAIRPDAALTIVNSHSIALFESARRAAERGEPEAALRWYERLAALLRVHESRSLFYTALQQVGALKVQFGDRGDAGQAFAELLRLCATSVRRRPDRNPSAFADMAAEIELQSFDLKCYFPDGLEDGLAILAGDVASLEIATENGSAADRMRLADAYFYHGTALYADSLYDKAAAAFDRSLALRTAIGTRASAAGAARDLTPYVMARRARMPGGAEWHSRLKVWLLAQREVRKLSRDEEDLLSEAESSRVED